jgi:hypothetical protein
LSLTTSPWSKYLETAHLPGKSNLAADATSRHPSPSSNVEVNIINITDMAELATLASIRCDAEEISTISWQSISQATQVDQRMHSLLETVCAGFPENARHLPHAAPFWRYRDSLYISDGVILYEDRMVVPPSLCKQVLKGLHAAYQGVLTMEMQACAIVFWPGMTENIHKARAACVDCIQNAPSQASLPSTPATPPSTPFEQIFH